jgi:hypothetical protein
MPAYHRNGQAFDLVTFRGKNIKFFFYLEDGTIRFFRTIGRL